MHIYIVFAHPSMKSFNRAVLEAFTQGLKDSGNTYEIGDLYEMNFISIMDVDHYEREVGLDPDAPVPEGTFDPKTIFPGEKGRQFAETEIQRSMSPR